MGHNLLPILKPNINKKKSKGKYKKQKIKKIANEKQKYVSISFVKHTRTPRKLLKTG